MQRRAAAAYVALFAAIAVVAGYGSFTGLAPDLSHNLWAIAVLTAGTAIILLGAAYLPTRRE